MFHKLLFFSQGQVVFIWPLLFMLIDDFYLNLC